MTRFQCYRGGQSTAVPPSSVVAVGNGRRRGLEGTTGWMGSAFREVWGTFGVSGKGVLGHAIETQHFGVAAISRRCGPVRLS